MPLIPDHLIDEIQARADIVDVIGRYAPLTRAGQHYKTCCPFHQERTPSFMVNTQKQIFHCFGCGVGGNVFSFLMRHERLTFPEAVRQLADQVGVRLPDAAGVDRSAPLFELLEKVTGYFERWLQDAARGKAAKSYLLSRGVSDETRARYRLGFAPAGWDHLLTAATAAGVSPEQLEAAGLVIPGRTSRYDRFRNRLIFPIMDVRGRVVGFGGRSLDGQEPKYLNSPETAVYSKSRQLFGLPQAKDALVSGKTAIVVEGYFDCLVLVNAGIAPVVSPLGTAFTTEHARLLRRYVETVILAFDPDAAGEQATLRGIDLLVEADLRVRVAELPSGIDPDECLRASGVARFRQRLEDSASVIEFLLQTARRRYPLRTTEEKVQAAQFVLPTIAKVPNAILRREYARLVAQRIDVDEAAVTEELRKVQPRRMISPVAVSARPAQPGAQGPERLLVALTLEDPSRWQRTGLRVEDITDAALRRILAVVCGLHAAGHPVTPAHVVSRVSQDGLDAAVSGLAELAQASPDQEAAFADCVRRVQASARAREQTRLRQQIRAAEEAGQDIEVQRLLGQYQRMLGTRQRTAGALANA